MSKFFITAVFLALLFSNNSSQIFANENECQSYKLFGLEKDYDAYLEEYQALPDYNTDTRMSLMQEFFTQLQLELKEKNFFPELKQDGLAPSTRKNYYNYIVATANKVAAKIRQKHDWTDCTGTDSQWFHRNQLNHLDVPLTHSLTGCWRKAGFSENGSFVEVVPQQMQWILAGPEAFHADYVDFKICSRHNCLNYQEHPKKLLEQIQAPLNKAEVQKYTHYFYPRLALQNDKLTLSNSSLLIPKNYTIFLKKDEFLAKKLKEKKCDLPITTAQPQIVSEKASIKSVYKPIAKPLKTKKLDKSASLAK